MADMNDEPSPLDVVPYDTHREIVLRHNDSIVVYDPSSHQLVPRSSSVADLNHASCPTCHQPWPDHAEDLGPGTPAESDSGTEGGFRNPDYFQLLQQGFQNSTEPSGPPSPIRRRLVQGSGAPSETQTPAFFGYAAPPDGYTSISSSAYSQGFLESHFPVVKELGRGGRGVVFLVEHVLNNIPLGFHACKRIPVGDDHRWLEKVLQEVQLLARLRHQNLVAYQHVWLEKTQITSFGPPVPCAYILQEYCDAGDLQKYVVGSAPVTVTKEQLKDRLRRRSKAAMELPDLAPQIRKLHFDEIYSFFRDIAAGMKYLHDHGYIHRDLKPSNCLLKRNDQGGLTVLVSDFGEAQEQNVVRKSTGATGTVSYCAPEVLKKTSSDGPYGNFTDKSDIFSLGMILYFLCFASLPYQNANVLNEESEDLESLRIEVSQWTGFNGERKLRPDLPEELYFLLKRLLSVKPEHRPTVDEVVILIQQRTGHAEPKSQRQPRTPPQAFEEISPRRRIVPVDSPIPGSPRPTPTASTTAHSHAVAKVRPSRLRTSPTDDNIRTTSSEGYDNSAESPNRELILRHSHVSPERQGQLSPDRHRSESPDFPPTYLLEAGPQTRPTMVQRLQISLQSPQLRRISSFLLVTLKVISILQPCASRGMNPMTMYPLLLLALWDFGFGGRNCPFSVIALVVHCGVLGMSLSSNTLCAAIPKDGPWPEEAI